MRQTVPHRDLRLMTPTPKLCTATRPQHDDPITGLVVIIAGTPRPQPRARHVGGKVVATANPKAKAFRDALQRLAREAVSNVGGADALAVAWAGRALVVNIVCQFPTRRAERWGQLHTHKPDKDNLEKMALDCLVRAGALGGDDSRAATGTTSKVWGQTGFVSITITPAAAVTIPSRPVVGCGQAPAWLTGPAKAKRKRASR